MKTERNALKAGLFIVVCVVLVVGLIVGIKGVSRIIEPMQTRTAQFRLNDDLGGLNVGDDVRIGGYRVGVVRSIQVVQEKQGDVSPYVVVVFSMPGRYELREGAHLSIQGTLTGTSWLNFENLGAGELLQPQTPLVGHPGTFTVLANSLSQLAPQVAAIVQDVRTTTIPRANEMIGRFSKTADEFAQAGASTDDLIKNVRANLPMVLERYQTVADRTAEMMVQLRDLLGDTKGDIRGTMANLNQSTLDIKNKLPGALDKLDAALAGVNTAMADLQGTLANTRDLSESAKLLVDANRPRIDGMIRSLKSMSDNMRSASAEIRRSPWRLLYKPQPGEMANLNLFDAAREFAEGARALEDATQALQAAGKEQAADPARLKELMEEVQLKAGQYRELQQKLWDSVHP